ncbi:alpha/beta hydrolase [Actinoplanes sp. KI2]|uniref:alpha/beta hydrolase n=1 Tax=Actinoplanes sp. KI2 TaxID=2983315 RepID=UPI0021D58E53|nr:alpha/beta hydrolase [Actinoplanes sp. KI2]MCU7723346.1 alpha/beta hydrolase [Actinoplanes sp. KI2]
MTVDPGTSAPVPLDAELQLAYDAYLAEEPELAPMSPALLPRIRAEVDAEVAALTDLSHGGRFIVAEPSVPGLDGAPEVPLLVCTPAGAPAARPALYFIHGGGFFCNDHRLGLDQLLETAERFGATLVSVGYRLAPEHPYPAQIDDAYAGLRWVAGHANALGIDPERIVVTGYSAGGGLGAALALTVRDKGGPRLLGQLLMSPMLDDRNDSASAMQMDAIEFWDRSYNGFGWSSLLGDLRGETEVPQYAAPARATDLTGLPPAFLDVGSAECLRDEVLAYAGRIWQAGGRAELHVWPGGIHAFDREVPEARISKAAVAARHDWLQRLLATD